MLTIHQLTEKKGTKTTGSVHLLDFLRDMPYKQYLIAKV